MFPIRSSQLALVVLFLFAVAARAESVYKCRDADGLVAYQDRPCAASQRQAEVEIAPVPSPAASPEYAMSSTSRGTAPARGQRASKRAGSHAEPSSWECRTADGEVFYRHASCPKSLAQSGSAPARRGSGEKKKRETIKATPLPRAEACRRMAASHGRSGSGRDERASTYERNLGRDPCR